jgi:hypothetical protein
LLGQAKDDKIEEWRFVLGSPDCKVARVFKMVSAL